MADTPDASVFTTFTGVDRGYVDRGYREASITWSTRIDSVHGALTRLMMNAVRARCLFARVIAAFSGPAE